MKVQYGDIVFIHSHSFLSLGIQFFENLWRWVGFKWKPFWAELPNHVAMGDNDNRIIEAIQQGVFSQPFNRDEIRKGKKTIKVYSYPWSDEQKKVIDEVYDNLEGKPYQIVNFFQNIIYTLTFGVIWLGRKGDASNGAVYCSKLGAEIMYKTTTRDLVKSDLDSDAHVYFRDYWKTTPYQMSVWIEDNAGLTHTYEIDSSGNITEII